MSFLLDFDRASSVFALLFAFTRDEACTDPDIQSFESSLFEITQGARLPEGAYERLRPLYVRAMEEPRELAAIAQEVRGQFERDREALLALARVLLRLSVDEGMLCRRDQERMQRVMEEFNFSWAELELLPQQERDFLAALCSYPPPPNGSSGELDRHYQTLGCDPSVSDHHLRAAYRRLAKRYHPDGNGSRAPTKQSDGSSHRFREVQEAYTVILKSRKV